MTASPLRGPDPGPCDPAPPDAAAFLAGLRARTGTEVGASAWTLVDQARIDRFAEATGDRQFVHVDPVRAATETPFGGTVAHGYLTLSLLGGAVGEVLPAHPCVRAVLNMAADKVRFLAPVRVDTRVRAVFTLTGVSALPEGKAALRLGAAVQAEGGEPGRPVLTAELTLMLVLDETAGADT
ncbi:MaoC family dehydratase [Methylobacterium radiodurans]|uniref:MaoC-like domain-containing protein n=1 Tax=Methylobacterium radiodurans TaxID=2202828 RepID=A0A2U8VR77_9HYPH|nr:MaoC family dehydratase [Methylobacterium radiodurans]AWN35716.1 hypothetical protein DK427_08140 [Methylobacterium radiodurans]